MPSTSAPSDPIAAIVFDGRSARPWPATLRREPGGMEVDIGSDREVIALDRLRHGRDGAGSRTVLHRTDRPDWRALSDVPLPAAWLAGIAPLHRPSRGKVLAAVGATAAVILAVAGLWFEGGRLLTWAAPLVPHRAAATVGRAVIQQMSFGTRQCTAPAGRAALGRLVARLQPAGGFVEPLQITVIENPAVNAFAAPGGQIAIFSGLIDKAKSADEVAGVLAHEMGHVQLRHPTKALIRHTGLSLVAQAVGGNVGGVADLALLLHRTRAAEADADAEAIRMLSAAAISPQGLAAFFERLRNDPDRRREGDGDSVLDRLADYAATHPSDASRQTVMAEAARQVAAPTPAADAADWRALRAICGGR